MRLNSLLFVVALSALLAGCGGGGGSSHGPVATETDFVSGDLVGRSAISSPPITTSSYNCTATGLVGTFTSLRLKESTSSLDETRLVFYSRTLDNNMEIYSCAVDGGDIQRLTNSPGDDFNASTSFAGKIAFATSREGPIRVYTMNLDGTNQVSIPSVPGANDYAPKWSLDGTKISYVSNRTGSPQIFVTDLTTLTTTQISNRSFAINAWQSLITSDNKWVFYNDSASIFKAPITGGSESPILTETAAIDCMSQAPDGSEMAEVVSGASTSKITRFSPYYPNARQIVSVPLTVIALTYSPDGKKFALSAYTGSNVVNLYTMNIDGTGLMRITNRAATFEYVSWSGFPKDRSLVAASGGSFGTRASGIIYTQQGPGTSSVLLLDVTTPSSLVMTQTTGLNANGPNLVFSVDADSITKMTYQNRSPYRGTKVIGPGASIPTANGALISIDSGSGQVVGVLPFNGSRSADSRPTFKDVGNTRVFTGAFLGVYDRSGVNVAPSGASEVRLDIATGKLTVH